MLQLQLSASVSTLGRVRSRFVGLDDFLHQTMADNILLRKIALCNAIHVLENMQRIHKAAAGTRIIKKLLEGVQVCLKTDFFANREELTAQADKILFTGMIDEFYDYCYGELEYRSLRFETEVLDMGNYQGNAVVNYTDYEVPYTRIIEHKHFEFGTQPKTVITREYPAAWEKGKEPYYPINDPKNDELFDKYERRALEEKNVLFGGRLGMYRYMDMDKVIEEALNMAETELTYEEV